jgi:hypothetical protein
MEGVIRQTEIDLEVLAVDTHGYVVIWTPWRRRRRSLSQPICICVCFRRSGYASHQAGTLSGEMSIELTDESGTPVAVVSAFVAYLSARDCSPITIIAYAHDLAHLWRFLSARKLAWHELRPLHTVEFLQFPLGVTTLHRSRRTGSRLASQQRRVADSACSIDD